MPHHDHQRPHEHDVEYTPDGRRVRLGELSLPEEPRRGNLLQRLRRNLALFLAGMYTGESCAGTPHSTRSRKGGTSGQEQAGNQHDAE
ncbi:MAG: hypothetical protein WEB57_04715 [Pseudohongiellaceae bacterium]